MCVDELGSMATGRAHAGVSASAPHAPTQRLCSVSTATTRAPRKRRAGIGATPHARRCSRPRRRVQRGQRHIHSCLLGHLRHSLCRRRLLFRLHRHLDSTHLPDWLGVSTATTLPELGQHRRLCLRFERLRPRLCHRGTTHRMFCVVCGGSERRIKRPRRDVGVVHLRRWPRRWWLRRR